MTRHPLPHRRVSRYAPLEWHGTVWTLGVGFNRAGQVKELFLDGGKVGSDHDALMDDTCVVLSVLLQTGASIGDVTARLSREGIEPGAPFASLIGAAVHAAEQLEAQHGTDIAAYFQSWEPA